MVCSVSVRIGVYLSIETVVVVTEVSPFNQAGNTDHGAGDAPTDGPTTVGMPSDPTLSLQRRDAVRTRSYGPVVRRSVLTFGAADARACRGPSESAYRATPARFGLESLLLEGLDDFNLVVEGGLVGGSDQSIALFGVSAALAVASSDSAVLGLRVM